MKKSVITIMSMLVLASCTDHQLVENVVAEETASQATVSEFETLREKARWGDGQAYLRLADCYRLGIGVKSDFIGMLSMAAMAQEFGGIQRMENYLDSISKESEFRMLIDAIDSYEKQQVDEAVALKDQLVSKGSPEGYTVSGIMAKEHGDSIEGEKFLLTAANEGSSFAALLLCLQDWRDGIKPEVTKLELLSDKVPWVNKVLGDLYSGQKDGCQRNDSLAAFYYLKADKEACLDRSGVKWLLDYQRSGGDLHLDQNDLMRLQILSEKE